MSVTAALPRPAAAEPATRACPLCGSGMRPTGEAYAMEDIFEWWRRQRTDFSQAVRQAHAAGGRIDLWECPACRFGQFYPVIPGSPAFYEELERSAQDWYYRGLKWEFLNGVRVLRRAGARSVLDIGCGNGHFLALAAARCDLTRAAGIESNPAAASAARAKGLEIHSVPIESASLTGQTFDAVTAFQVLEHVADPAVFFAEARRVLGPGGALVLGVPNQAGPIRHFRPYLQDLPPHHLTRWRPETFALAAPRFGFRLIEHREEPLAQVHFEWLLPVYASRLGPRALRRPLWLAGAVFGRVCRWLRVPSLPLRGHTLFIHLERGA